MNLSELQRELLTLMAIDGARGVIAADPKPPTSPRVVATIHAVINSRHEAFVIAVRAVRQLSIKGMVWIDPICTGDQIQSCAFGVTDVGREWLAIYQNSAANQRAVAAMRAKKRAARL